MTRENSFLSYSKRPSSAMDDKMLLSFYQKKFEEQQCKEDEYKTKIDKHLENLTSDRHDLEEEVLRKGEKISDLQKALVELQLSVFEERGRFIKASAEKEELKRKEKQLHGNIRHLLSMTQQKDLRDKIIYILKDPTVEIGYCEDFPSKHRFTSSDISVSKKLKSELDQLKNQMDEMLKFSKKKSDIVLEDCKQALENSKKKIVQDDLLIKDLKRKLHDLQVYQREYDSSKSRETNRSSSETQSSTSSSLLENKHKSSTGTQFLRYASSDEDQYSEYDSLDETKHRSSSKIQPIGQKLTTKSKLFKPTSSDEAMLFKHILSSEDQLFIHSPSVDDQLTKPKSSAENDHSRETPSDEDQLPLHDYLTDIKPSKNISSSMKDIHLSLILFFKVISKVNSILNNIQATKIYQRIAKTPKISSLMDDYVEDRTVTQLETYLRQCTRLTFDINNMHKSLTKYVLNKKMQIQYADDLEKELNHLEDLLKDLTVMTTDTDLLNISLKRSDFFSMLKGTTTSVDKDNVQNNSDFYKIINNCNLLSKAVSSTIDFVESIIQTYRSNNTFSEMAQCPHKSISLQLQKDFKDAPKRSTSEPIPTTQSYLTSSNELENLLGIYKRTMQEADNLGYGLSAESKVLSEKLLAIQKKLQEEEKLKENLDNHKKDVRDDMSQTHSRQKEFKISQTDPKVQMSELSQTDPKWKTWDDYYRDEISQTDPKQKKSGISQTCPKFLISDTSQTDPKILASRSFQTDSQLKKANITQTEPFSKKFKMLQTDPQSKRIGMSQTESHTDSKLRKFYEDFIFLDKISQTDSRSKQSQRSQTDHKMKHSQRSQTDRKMKQSQISQTDKKLEQTQLSQTDPKQRTFYENFIFLDEMSQTDPKLKQSHLSQTDHKMKQSQISQTDKEFKHSQLSQTDPKLKFILLDEMSQTDAMVKQSELSQTDHKVKQSQVSQTDTTLRQSELSQTDHKVKQSQVSQTDKKSKQSQLSQTDPKLEKLYKDFTFDEISQTDFKPEKHDGYRSYMKHETTQADPHFSTSDDIIKQINKGICSDDYYKSNTQDDTSQTDPTFVNSDDILRKINKTLSKVKQLEQGVYFNDEQVCKNLVENVNELNSKFKELADEFNMKSIQDHFSEHSKMTLNKLEELAKQSKSIVIAAEAQIASHRSNVKHLSQKLKETEELLRESVNECLSLKQKVKESEEQSEMNKYTFLSGLRQKLQKMSNQNEIEAVINDLINFVAEDKNTTEVARPFVCVYCQQGKGHKLCEEKIRDLRAEDRKSRTMLKLLQQEMKQEKATQKHFKDLATKASAELATHSNNTKEKLQQLEKKNSVLLEQLKVERNRVKNIERFRHLEIEGFQTDIKNLKTKIRDMEKQLVKAVMIFENGSKDMELLKTVHETAQRSKQAISTLRRLKAKLYELQNDFKYL